MVPVRSGGDNLVFLTEDEEDVHAVELFDGVVTVRVLEDDLLAAELIFTFDLGDQGCCVAAALCRTGAACLRGRRWWRARCYGFGGAK